MTAPVPTPHTHFWSVPAHPTGAWGEKRRLAATLRELVELCVTTDAPEADLAAATAALTVAAARLRQHPTRTFHDGWTAAGGKGDMAQFADRGTLVGHCNPFAPPMTFRDEHGSAVGDVVFGPVYEGAPGFVHGGVVAAAFDQLFGFTLVSRGVSALTGSLTIHYRRPTPLAMPLRFEGSVARSDGRKHIVKGRCLAGGQVVADSEGLFVEVEQRRLDAMFAGGSAEEK